MSGRTLFRLALVVGLLAAAPAAARAEQPPMRIYTTADGLASEEVLSVLVDSRGFLWFHTSDGVLKPLSDAIRNLCDEAILKAEREGRRTLLERDIPDV